MRGGGQQCVECVAQYPEGVNGGEKSVTRRRKSRILRDQGRSTEAREILAPVYDWFAEGLGTPDLQDAKALLDELV